MKAQLLYERLGNCMPGDSISISASALKDILGEVRPDFEIIDSEEEGEATYTLRQLRCLQLVAACGLSATIG